MNQAAYRVKGLRNVVDLWPLRYSRGRTALAVLSSGDVVAARAKLPQIDASALEVESVPLITVRGVAQLAVGHRVACARKRDGTVACFTINSPFDTPDDRPDPNATRPALVPVDGLSNVVDIGTTTQGFSARTRDGAVMSFAHDGARASVQPQPVSQGAVAMSHYKSVYTVMPDGGVMATSGRYGAHGPQRRDDLGPAVAVEDRAHACLVRPNGKVACWGSNLGEACGVQDRYWSPDFVTVRLPPE
jgi:hypothetical protein